MKSYVFYALFLLGGMFIFSSCQNKALLGDKGEEQFQVLALNDTVWIGEYNEIAALVLNLSKEHFLKEVQMHIASEDTIESLRIYQVLENEGSGEKMPIAALQNVIGDITIYLDKDLPAGEHKFLVSVFPQEKSLSDDVRVNFSHFTTDRGQINNMALAETSIYPLRRVVIPEEEDIEEEAGEEAEKEEGGGI